MADPVTVSFYARLAIAKDQKQIRLLKLLPSVDTDQISCTLEVVNWTPKLQYAAISYVWGESKIKKTISINDQPLHIQENLHTALWHIRKNDMLQQDGSEQPLPLWADAVCIDQDNNDERNHQVSLMESIYGSASRVIYWLGRPKDDSLSGDIAITAIREMAEAAFHDGSDLDMECLKNFLAAHEGLNLPIHDVGFLGNLPPVWQSIVHVLKSEFWERVWIIQEFALPVSQDVLRFTCGNSTTTLTQFLQFIRIVDFINKSSDNSLCSPESLHRNLDIAFMPGRAHISMLREFRRRDRQLSPASLPALAILYKASNPLDYVYGFRAVLDIQSVVNYEKSKKEVYMDWFKDAIKNSPVFDITVWAGIGLLGPANQEWPSWLPDLASIRDTPHKLAARSMIEKGRDSQQPPRDIDGNVLHISGVRLGDTVAKIFQPEPGAPKRENGFTPSFLHYVCRSILANASSHHPLCVTPLQAFLITMVNCFKQDSRSRISSEHPLDTNDPMLMGVIYHIAEGFVPQSEFSHDDDLSIYGPEWVSMKLYNIGILSGNLVEQLLGTSSVFPPEMMRKLTNAHHDPGGLLSAHLKDYATFQTTNGHIGIGPPGLKEGDELWFFSERDTPGLLRLEKKNDKMVTKFVGACYIHESSVSAMRDSVPSGSARYERLSLH